MLLIKIPPFCGAEISYIVHTVFCDILGVKYELTISSEAASIVHILPNNRKLTIEVPFFVSCAKLGLLSTELVPTRINWFRSEFFADCSMPVLYGSPEVTSTKTDIHCAIDIYGTCFFLISRLEEYLISTRDIHHRFPAFASTAYKNGFLDRPIVDEYVEMLFNMLYTLDSSITRLEKKGKIVVTCDVDLPFDPIRRSLFKTIQSTLSAIIKHQNYKQGSSLVQSYFKNLFGISQKDEFRNNIEWMMDINEQCGNKMYFFFIPHKTSKMDSSISFDSNDVRMLIREIHSRGHHIGIHPGYETYNNPEQFKKSVAKFKQVLSEEGIKPDKFGGRQHFLMWDMSLTPHLWEKAGLDYDSSLCFADKAGFRCGTCHEFSIYDCTSRRVMNLREKPLILMECTVISPRYEGLGISDMTADRIETLKQYALKHKGEFVLLWHNNFAYGSSEKEMYYSAIRQ